MTRTVQLSTGALPELTVLFTPPRKLTLYHLLCARQQAECFKINLINPTTPPLATAVITILQTEETEAQRGAATCQGQTASKWGTQD